MKPARPTKVRIGVSWALVCVIGFLSIPVVQNLLSTRQIMNTSFEDRLQLVNTYGAFGSIGREQYVVVFQGSDSEFPVLNSDWKEYPYRGIPVDLRQMPPSVAPYQLHFDWQMWFASMAGLNEYPWTIHLVWKLLHGDPLATQLFARNPFPDHPPRFVRATLYRYRFAPPGNPEGHWWERQELQEWFPTVAKDDQRLIQAMELEGWMQYETK